MKIVLSRKGSDSSWGGGPSMRLGSELISFPIPEPCAKETRCTDMSHLRYRDLPERNDIGAFHQYLPKVRPDMCVHLDPDIRPELRGTNRAAPGALGQSMSAGKHLRNHELGPNDLFLFFGWFRDFALDATEGYTAKGPDQHAIWGWLQIDSVVNLEDESQKRRVLKEFSHHPHVCRKTTNSSATLYVARKQLSFNPALSGSGVFPWSQDLCLTECSGNEVTRTHWCVPSFFQQTGLTYHSAEKLSQAQVCPNNKEFIHFVSASRGQEFVFPRDGRLDIQNNKTKAAVHRWVTQLFKNVVSVS
jgi:hypothetical protein